MSPAQQVNEATVIFDQIRKELEAREDYLNKKSQIMELLSAKKARFGINEIPFIFHRKFGGGYLFLTFPDIAKDLEIPHKIQGTFETIKVALK